MKKLFILTIMSVFAFMPVSAQYYQGNRPGGGPAVRHHDSPGYRVFSDGGYADGTCYYFGFRIGPAFSHISTDNSYIDELGSKTGLNIGVAAGIGLSPRLPLFLESGLYYTAKGAKKSSVKVSLNYLEIPLVFKYIYNVDRNISIQPFLGGYFGLGIGGKVKLFDERESWSSFGDNSEYAGFKHGDAGLRLGCGFGYDMFYAELAYDLGLANTAKDEFDDCHNGTFYINLGVNF